MDLIGELVTWRDREQEHRSAGEGEDRENDEDDVVRRVA